WYHPAGSTCGPPATVRATPSQLVRSSSHHRRPPRLWRAVSRGASASARQFFALLGLAGGNTVTRGVGTLRAAGGGDYVTAKNCCSPLKIVAERGARGTPPLDCTSSNPLSPQGFLAQVPSETLWHPSCIVD